jgi:hypothetical protein
LKLHSLNVLKADEIAEAAGLDKAVVDKAMKVLKTEGKIESPKVCYWQPKQNTAPPTSPSVDG